MFSAALSAGADPEEVQWVARTTFLLDNIYFLGDFEQKVENYHVTTIRLPQMRTPFLDILYPTPLWQHFQDNYKYLMVFKNPN